MRTFMSILKIIYLAVNFENMDWLYKTICKMFSKFMNLFNRITFDISKYTYMYI